VVGYEVAGTIEEVGPGVDGLTPGQRVLAFTRFGGYSDVVAVPTTLVLPIPDSLSLEQAAAIPVAYLTAWMMLVWLGNVHAGETVLVHAAAGGVGQAALQICRHFGAEVLGTASGGKHERLRQLGVTHPIDYRSQDFEEEVERVTGGRGVDIALDAVGGESFKKSYRCLAPLGRLFVFGASSMVSGTKRNLWTAFRQMMRMPRFKPLAMMSRNRGVLGVNLLHLWQEVGKIRLMLGEIAALTEEGKLDPVVDESFPFDRASEAHAYIQARKNFGKVLLTP
jgi:NADPH:quinone reductase-like Zn-dependent oxidoreductase